MNKAIATELEQGGLVALIAMLLLPGMVWISKAQGGKNMAVRSAVVVGLIGSALAIEAAMDRTAGEVEEALV